MWFGMKFMGYRYFHFARHQRIAALRAKGWRVLWDLSGCHHGDHGVMMELDG